MARLNGYDGTIKFRTNGTVDAHAAPLHINSWTLDDEADEIRSSGMGEAFEESATTVRRWRGTLSVDLPKADAQRALLVPKAVLDCQFYPGDDTVVGDPYWSGTAHVLSRSIAADKGAFVTYQVNFSGDGALVDETI